MKFTIILRPVAFILPLLGRRSLSVAAAVIAVPHGHGDGIMQDERPYQAEDELQFAVDNVAGICIMDM